jgi:uncharacterized protein with ParB-like and HNH nuclease domain
MQANEMKIQKLIESTQQYQIPLFQRSYSWTKKEWDVLWKDLEEMCESDVENQRPHFIGSIVSVPAVLSPGSVTKYLLIDGQQRLTTIFILLTLLRDKARAEKNMKLEAEIHERFLVNKFQEGLDHFKLLPTQVDREAFMNYITDTANAYEITQPISEQSIQAAYHFFKVKLKQTSIATDTLKTVIVNAFSLVSIMLESHDNPYLVFESLNAKGKPLSESDLIRNYFFMRVTADKQVEVYHKYWQPMQDALGERLTEFIRHYLMVEGGIIKQNDVYYELKKQVTDNNSIIYLKKLNQFSFFYDKLLHPNKETHLKIRDCLWRLNKLEVTTAYPLLMNCYDAYSLGKLDANEFVMILQYLESYLIRRFVCTIPTNQLNKIFPLVIVHLISKQHLELVEQIALTLQTKGYPKDVEFKNKFMEVKMYGSGDRVAKTKFILANIEANFYHKEMIDINEKVTVEHIMPQVLTEWWKAHLGSDWANIHENYIHNIGNLTLSAYNSELSNNAFNDKVESLKNSHLELNKYFNNLSTWDEVAIKTRARLLADKALSVWKYFGKDYSTQISHSPRNKTPKELWFLGEVFQVNSWRDVLVETLNAISVHLPEKFDLIIAYYPRYFSKDKYAFRDFRLLKNHYYVDSNFSIQRLQQFCERIFDTIGLKLEDWKVILNS